MALRRYSLGSVGVVQQDLHSFWVQVLKGDQGDSVRLVVTVEDLKQVGAAASQNSSVSHQFMTTDLKNNRKANQKWITGLQIQ